MGHNDQIDFELHDDIEALVAEGLLEEGSVAHGIAQQVINQGYDSALREAAGRLGSRGWACAQATKGRYRNAAAFGDPERLTVERR